MAAGHTNDQAARDGAIPERTASSLRVEFADQRTLVLDVSIDFRLQWWPYSRLPDAVALTHGHMGHYSGLLHFGRESASAIEVPCFVTDSMADHLTNNAPWSQLIELRNLSLRKGREHEWAGHHIELIPVPHRSEFTDTVAISVDGRLLYLPDIDSWTGWPDAVAVVRQHRVAFVDASFWSADEVPDRSLDEIPHPLATDTIERFGDIDTRMILTHLNHTNPLCDPTSRETQQVIELGFDVAHDGLTVVV